MITGAGASHDCWLRNASPPPAKEWRPPLSKDLFSPSVEFQKILSRYPAGIHAGVEFLRRQNKVSLEDFVSELLGRGVKDVQYRRQAVEVTCYLQDLFVQVSKEYLPFSGRVANAYTWLTGEIYRHKEQFTRVCFVNPCYDVFLDLPLGGLLGVTFDQIEKYIALPERWLYIKPHGSANWMRRIIAEGPGPYMERLCATADVRLGLKEDVKVFGLPELEKMAEPVTARGWYPAMTAPTGGGYRFACPTGHVEALRHFLRSGPLVILTIGFSGRDDDLIAEIRGHAPKILKLLAVDPAPAAINHVHAQISGQGGLAPPWAEGLPVGFATFVAQFAAEFLESWQSFGAPEELPVFLSSEFEGLDGYRPFALVLSGQG